MEINWYIEKITEIQNNLQEKEQNERTHLTTAILAEIAKDQRIKQMKEDREKQRQLKQLNDNAPPTAKQSEWLKKYGENPDNYKTKQEASQKLDELFNKK